jgi:hypothetical protein
MDKSPIHDGIAREICIVLETIGADAKLFSSIRSMEEHESAETVYLRKCDDAIRRAAREMEGGWN